MNEEQMWEENNQRYLSLALQWLRLRLERLAQDHPSEAVPASPPTIVVPAAPDADPIGRPSHRRFLLFRTGRSSPIAPPSPAQPLPALTVQSTVDESPTSQDLDAELAAAESADPAPAMMVLCQRLGLSPFERSVLLFSAAMELDTRIPDLCARAQDSPSAAYPTFALAFAAFDEPSWDALAPGGALRYWRLIDVHRHGAQPLTTSPVVADERITNYLKGLNHIDDRLRAIVAALAHAGEARSLPPSQDEAVEHILTGLRQAGEGRLPVVQLVGADPASKEELAVAASSRLGLHPYRLPDALLPTAVSELETFGRLWERETRLAPVSLYLDAFESDPTGREGSPSSLNRFLSGTGGLIFVDTRDTWPGMGRTSMVIDVAKPTAAEQQAAWTSALGDQAGASAALLAGQFDLSLAAIEEVAASVATDTGDVAGEEGTAGATLHSRLWTACLAASRPRMDALAQRLDAKATWNDIVLPERELKLLWELANQVSLRSTVYDEWGFRGRMNRGLGITALFAGESGTGKTMAAEVIANHLQLNLYRIDLSAVVSKYIGETEKNLRRLFDAAEDGGAILFFDEADALFGKRSEVKDSHDRYANIEVNYLLQRMESYRGLAILGTNRKEALDQAFLRRLRYLLRFPFPPAAQRKAIWERVFPPETPTEGLDLDRLARINLTGGSIHSVALNAAFLAAQARQPVTMPLVLDAARNELTKLERPINEAELKWVPPAEARP